MSEAETIFDQLKARYPQSVLIVPDADGVAQLYSHGMDADVVALVLYQLADRIVAEHGTMPKEVPH